VSELEKQIQAEFGLTGELSETKREKATVQQSPALTTNENEESVESIGKSLLQRLATPQASLKLTRMGARFLKALGNKALKLPSDSIAFELTIDEENDIAEALYEVLQKRLPNLKITPEVWLLLCGGLIYGEKFTLAQIEAAATAEHKDEKRD
jgi:hypothetical protein